MTAVISGPHVAISDDDLERLSAENPGWQFERADDGALLVSPTSTSTGAKSARALLALFAYAETAGGKVYDAGTGFKTPRGGVVSPDASWISAERVAAHEGIDGYWQLMPDIVVEVASPNDSWKRLCRKIDKYIADGAAHAIAIDPQTGESYEGGAAPAGFALDRAAIVRA